MGSTRLPGKIFMNIGKKPLIEHILRRLELCIKKYVIVIATTDSKRDDVVENYCRKNGVPVFRGSESDVLDRYYKCSIKYSAKNIVRLTADNPFIDLEYCLKALKFHVEQKNDLTQINHLPIGMGVNIVRLNGLKKAINDKKDNDTEIWGNYFKLNSKLKTQIFKNIKKKHIIRNLRLTLDEPRDYKLIKIVTKNINIHEINSENIFKFFRKFPELKKINSNVKQRRKNKVNIKNEKN